MTNIRGEPKMSFQVKLVWTSENNLWSILEILPCLAWISGKTRDRSTYVRLRGGGKEKTSPREHPPVKEEADTL